MKSMTGFGRAIGDSENYNIVVDLKSVNGKFLDIVVKSGKLVSHLEDKIKKKISEKISRGTIEISVNYTIKSGLKALQFSFNEPVIKTLFDEAKNIATKNNIPFNVTMADIIKLPITLDQIGQESSSEELDNLVLNTVDEALSNFIKAREIEGENLRIDLKEKIDKFSVLLSKIKEQAPLVQKEYLEKLTLRIKEILGDVELDETKLFNEVAFFVDKADINEEIVRLDSHVSQFNSLLNDDLPVGKKLEFLMQEFTRETNTLGSKANNLNLTNLVLDAKNLVETIKEQMRNVE